MTLEIFLTRKPSHVFLLHIRLLTCLKQESHPGIQSSVGEKIRKQVTVASRGKATIQTDDEQGKDSYCLLSSPCVSGIILANSCISTYLILTTTLQEGITLITQMRKRELRGSGLPSEQAAVRPQ